MSLPKALRHTVVLRAIVVSVVGPTVVSMVVPAVISMVVAAVVAAMITAAVARVAFRVVVRVAAGPVGVVVNATSLGRAGTARGSGPAVRAVSVDLCTSVALAVLAAVVAWMYAALSSPYSAEDTNVLTVLVSPALVFPDSVGGGLLD